MYMICATPTHPSPAGKLLQFITLFVEFLELSAISSLTTGPCEVLCQGPSD